MGIFVLATDMFNCSLLGAKLSMYEEGYRIFLNNLYLIEY